MFHFVICMIRTYWMINWKLIMDLAVSRTLLLSRNTLIVTAVGVVIPRPKIRLQNCSASFICGECLFNTIVVAVVDIVCSLYLKVPWKLSIRTKDQMGWPRPTLPWNDGDWYPSATHPGPISNSLWCSEKSVWRNEYIHQRQVQNASCGIGGFESLRPGRMGLWWDSTFRYKRVVPNSRHVVNYTVPVIWRHLCWSTL